LKLELFASAFLTLAVMELALGVYFIRGDRTVEGVLCVVAGFGLVVSAIALFEWGVMERLGRFGPFCFIGPRSQPSATPPPPASGIIRRPPSLAPNIKLHTNHVLDGGLSTSAKLRLTAAPT
jgi:hypothetical protein